jgi:hypothetical protein
LEVVAQQPVHVLVLPRCHGAWASQKNTSVPVAAVFNRCSAGLPVLADDREHLQGWITPHDIRDALTRTLQSSEQAIEQGAVAADFGADDPALAAHQSSTSLAGYEIVELAITPGSTAIGRCVDDIAWPPNCHVVAVTAVTRCPVDSCPDPSKISRARL